MLRWKADIDSRYKDDGDVPYFVGLREGALHISAPHSPQTGKELFLFRQVTGPRTLRIRAVQTVNVPAIFRPRRTLSNTETLEQQLMASF